MDVPARLEFIKACGDLKDTLRSAYTPKGSAESSAEHSWRLALWILVFDDALPAQADRLKLMKMAILHDLGEAITGDTPAPLQTENQDKHAQELAAWQELLAPLPQALQTEFLALWQEYEQAQSLEARLVKGLDKLETMVTHNQGANPADFDYAWNLDYGRQYTSDGGLLETIRALVDAETQTNAERQGSKGAN